METDFNDVVERKRGNVRESSLFHFVNDWVNNPDKTSQNSILNSCYCQKGTGHRSVYFISRQDSDNDYQSIYADYKLVDCHLSVDKYYSLESAATSSTLFRATHITMVFKNDRALSEGRVIRIYFNPDVQLATNSIHMMNCRLNASNHVCEQIGDSLIISELEKNNVFENQHFQQHKALLNELTKEKLNAFMDKQSFSYQLSEQLAQEFEAKNLPNAKLLALKLKKLTEEITYYNDEIIDGRTKYLAKLIEFYERLMSNSMPIASVHEKSNLPYISKEYSTTESSLNKVNNLLLGQAINSEAEEDLKKKIVMLVSSINQKIMDDQIDIAKKLLDSNQLLQEFNESCLILSGNDTTPQKIKQFIQQQRNEILSFDLSIFDYFKNAVNQGNLEHVQQLHDLVSCGYDLQNLYSTLLWDILPLNKMKKNTVNNELLSRQVAIADYFYDTSTLFKSTTKIFQYAMTCDSVNNLRSHLVGCFISDNWDGFRMLLRQKMSLSDVHFITGSHALNALQAIICLYFINPKPEYIQCLLDEGASTKFSILWHQAPQFTELKINTKGSTIQAKPFNFNPSLFKAQKSKLAVLDKMIRHSILKKNALQLTQERYGLEYPELIKIFMSYEKLDETILTTVKILASVPFRTLYLFDHKSLKIHEINDSQIIFNSKESFMEHLDTQPPLVNVCYIPRTFYYLPPDTINGHVLFGNISSIVNDLKTKFQTQPYENQKKILLSLFISQKKHCRTESLASQLSEFDVHQLIFLNSTIQLIFTWMTRYDDQANLWMTQSLEHIYSVLNKVNIPNLGLITQKKDEFQNSYHYFIRRLCDDSLGEIMTLEADKVSLEDEVETKSYFKRP